MNWSREYRSKEPEAWPRDSQELINACMKAPSHTASLANSSLLQICGCLIFRGLRCNTGRQSRRWLLQLKDGRLVDDLSAEVGGVGHGANGRK